MDVYLFVQTEPGQAEGVMNSLVSEGLASRAAAVTGKFDVIARREDLSIEDLAEISLREIGRINGVRAMRTSIRLSAERFGGNLIPPLRVPYEKGEIQAVVCGRNQPGSEQAIFQKLHGSDQFAAHAAITGEFDFMFQVRGSDIEEVASKVFDFRSTEGVLSTSTFWILAATALPAEEE
jgi:DNA-binding Lrp family transcriptional regulator